MNMFGNDTLRTRASMPHQDEPKPKGPWHPGLIVEQPPKPPLSRGERVRKKIGEVVFTIVNGLIDINTKSSGGKGGSEGGGSEGGE